MLNSMEKALNEQYTKISQNPSKFPLQSKWIAPKKSHGIKYVSFLGTTGYADAAKGYVRSLVESGIYVYFEPIRCYGSKTVDLLSEDDLVLSVCINNKHVKYDTLIIHTVPHYWQQIIEKERTHNPNIKIYGLTVWETDRVFPKWLKMISKANLNGLIVPSNWNQEIFIKSAKNDGLSQNFPKVETCHHLIADRSMSREKNSLMTKEYFFGSKKKTAFLCIGTWTPRKGISETIESYIQAFAGEQNVVLYVKTTSGNYSKKDDLILKERLEKILIKYQNPPEIILDTVLRSEDYIESLVEHSDVYISLCNSEGVGLGACGAALKGKIIVMTGFGGQTEYIKKAFWIDYLLDVVQVPSNFAEWIRPPQKWAYPNINHAIKCFKDIHSNLKYYQKEAKINRSFILQNFSSKSIGQKLLSIVGDKIKYNKHQNIPQFQKSNDNSSDILSQNSVIPQIDTLPKNNTVTQMQNYFKKKYGGKNYDSDFIDQNHNILNTENISYCEKNKHIVSKLIQPKPTQSQNITFEPKPIQSQTIQFEPMESQSIQFQPIESAPIKKVKYGNAHKSSSHPNNNSKNFHNVITQINNVNLTKNKPKNEHIYNVKNHKNTHQIIKHSEMNDSNTLSEPINNDSINANICQKNINIDHINSDSTLSQTDIEQTLNIDQTMTIKQLIKERHRLRRERHSERRQFRVERNTQKNK